MAFIDLGGVDAGDFEVAAFLVEVDFDIACLLVVDGVVGDGFPNEFPVHGDLEKRCSVVFGHVGDALDVELEPCILEKEVDVFQVSLDVFGERGTAFGVEVVFDLDLAVLENLGITLGEDDFLFLCSLFRVADKVQRLLQVIHHLLDFSLVSGQFFLGKRGLFLLGGRRCSNKKQQKKKNFQL